jgi:hypothetical protein
MRQYIIENKSGNIISTITIGNNKENTMDDLEHLEKTLNDNVVDEFKAVVGYDEVIEDFVRHRDIIKSADKHIDTLRRIQKEQSIHSLELVNMMMDMGFKEPAIIQKLEDFLKTKDYTG